MNFKKTFLQLTEYTIPFGHEKDLEPLLPKGWIQDSIGNYYYEIGESNTLFTSHLDVATDQKVKINHIIDGDIVKTDGKTILGGDNKAGCCILFYLIERGIPGTYYFFLGEESAVHKNYPYGSLMAIETRPGFFKKFKRSISFDRKETGELITRQLGYNCCSDEFADTLIEEFKKSGVEYRKDKTGYYTDNAFFGSIIPEITNLSAGVWNEHTKNEWVDLSYVRKVAHAAAEVDWENLPVVRNINQTVSDPRSDVQEGPTDEDKELFKEVFTILDNLYFVCREISSYQNFIHYFKPGRKYHFTEWHGDSEITISVENNKIYLIESGKEVVLDTLADFQKYLGIAKLDRLQFFDLMFTNFKNNDHKMSKAEFDNLVYKHGGNVKNLGKDFQKKGFKLNRIGKGYEIVKESTVYIKLFKRFTDERGN